MKFDDMFNELKTKITEAQFMDLSVVKNNDGPLDNREMARALRMAIAAEHEAVHLYELIADKSTDKKIKKVMQDIADEEKVHVGEIEVILASVDSDNPEKRAEGRDEASEIGD
jgi:rubrerythrin